MEKLAGDLLLGLKFVKLELLSTSLYFLYGKLGELRLRPLGLEGLKLLLLIAKINVHHVTKEMYKFNHRNNFLFLRYKYKEN